jgi:acetyltransferase-like isoleucine patch superfamily enzyme
MLPTIHVAKICLLRFTPLFRAWRVELEGDIEVTGKVWLSGPGRVLIGRGVKLFAHRAPIELCAHEGAELRLDRGVVVEAGASIEATGSIHVGARTRIGAFGKVMDNHFHHSAGDRNQRPPPVPVVIGRDCVIGPRAILMPGAELGAGARVGPAAVVSFRVPAGVDLANHSLNVADPEEVA